MRPILQKVIAAEAMALNLSTDVAGKLVHRIDEFKIMGYTGGEASSKFGDYLTFLGLPDGEAASEFFARRWVEHCVIIPVPYKLRGYTINDTPIFTVSRLEPQYETRPFYEQGIPQVAPGAYGTPDARGPVRTSQPAKQAYSNFIILENVPPVFYIEVDNRRLEEILTTGLPAVESNLPYKLYTSVADARDSLFRDLATHGHQRSTLNTAPTNFTLIHIVSDGLLLINDLFYTRTLGGHRQGSRAYGYYYAGAVAGNFISVSHSNISA